jgi:translation initiation factor IF-2
MVTATTSLSDEAIGVIADALGYRADVVGIEDELKLEEIDDLEASDGELVPRAPVVTIMGHVDHGKTKLLDAIRETDVVAGEFGGITQHIGAYQAHAGDREITFIDTPGHEAFTAMRARGAGVTDIVVLVVAADDGVMPQTVEALDHAKAANVPIVVAVNKIDKPEALPERVKKQLADRGLMPEDWGGQTVFVEVSAKKKTNLNLLMEMICLVADLQDLKANPDRAASGVVLEAKLDRGRGPVATVLVQNGTLKTGEYFVVGNVFGRVRAMFDEWSNPLDEAGPSTPVEILGLEGLPQAGDNFIQVGDREKAVGVSEYRTQKAREATLAKSSRVSLEGLAEKIKNEGVKELSIILKGDVQGSVEVLNDLLMKLSNDRVKIKVLRSGVGAINEGDVLLASASEAIIIGFNVRPERMAQELAEQEKVDIRLHSIIYELQDEIKKAMTGLLEPIIKETYQGRAEVRDTFRIPKVGMVAGCYIQDGIIKRDSEVRLLRDNVQVFKGKVGSLRRFKEDASEVRNGMECGIAIAGYGDVKVGDVIEAFVTEKVAAEAIA